MSTDADGKVLKSIPIVLHKDEIYCEDDRFFKGVTFNGKYRAYGRWMYAYAVGCMSMPLLLIEFAAGRGCTRRHVLVQITDDVFELANTDHPIYMDTKLWSSCSKPHWNDTKVFLQKWSRPAKPEKLH